MTIISLREITKDSLISFLRMKVHPEQEFFVATNGSSIAQAHYNENAWYRGIYAGEDPVGFVMLEIIPEEDVYYIWRYMIAAEHQRKGYGRAAMALVIDHIRSLPGAQKITLSHVEANEEAGALYQSVGFEYTGEIDEGERVMEMEL